MNCFNVVGVDDGDWSTAVMNCAKGEAPVAFSARTMARGVFKVDAAIVDASDNKKVFGDALRTERISLWIPKKSWE